MEEKNQEIKRPLSNIMTLFCCIFAAIFGITIGAMNFFIYEQDMMNRYHTYTADILNYVARVTDGDDLYQCMRTGKKSAKFEQLQKITNDLKETHKLEFLYIIQPISENPPDNMMDVLAAFTQYEVDYELETLTDLGNYTGDSYPPKIARYYLARMDKNPEVTFFQNDSDFGNIYTAIRPIFNSQGEPIAVVCADVLIDEIEEGKERFIKMSIAVALVAGIILVSVMSYFLRKRVAEPIIRLTNSATSFAERSHDEKNLDMISFEDPNIHTGDEIEKLSRALTSMCDDIKAYTEELIWADRQVTSLKETVVEMDNLAHKDSLTGAGNKAAYEKMISRMDWDILAEKAEFAIVMMDLNYLKKINDNFGHDKGNIYIIKAYNLIRQVFPTAEIFRIGGDEFVLILQGEDYRQAGFKVQLFKDLMFEQMKNSSLETWERISVAVGLAYYNRLEHDEAAAVFAEADKNMYKDKERMHAVRK